MWTRLFLGVWLAAALVESGSLRGQSAGAFEEEIRAFEEADRRNPPPPHPVLFVGSSSIRLWNSLARDFRDFTVMNRGFGGSQTSDVLRLFDRIVAPYRPALIVFYEGDNDLAAGKTPEDVFSDWTRFVTRVEQELPETGILFLAVKPSPSRIGFLEATRTLNERVRHHCELHPRCRFVDVFTPMLGPDGRPRADLFASDQLHLNPAGYVLWTSLVHPEIEAWATMFPVPSIRAAANALLIDFGAPDLPTGIGGASSALHWNNVPSSIGASHTGRIEGIVATDGTVTGVSFRMRSRFNGANENGTLSSLLFPESATRDSLFGNIESFGGLSHITPRFELAGLSAGVPYTFTFHASRLGVSDNRETRYVVTGATTDSAILNAANNVEGTALVAGMVPDDQGTISVSLTPGTANNNANHFTYLGVLRVDSEGPEKQSFLFDLGSAAFLTGTVETTPSEVWNNLTSDLGTLNGATLENLRATNGLATGIALTVLSRFNGANRDGTTEAHAYPASATADSLFGNIEAFNGGENILPVLELSGLRPDQEYRFTFHASRLGVSDSRETRYTVTGRSVAFADLDPANNINQVAVVAGCLPSATRTLRIALTPGPNNRNGNHFVYLNALSLEWAEASAETGPIFSDLAYHEGKFQMLLRGTPGVAWRLERTRDLQAWESVQTITPDSDGQRVEIPQAESHYFYRVIEEVPATRGRNRAAALPGRR